MRRSLALLVSFAFLAEPVVAHACSCAEWSYDEAFEHAKVVAEVEMLDVLPPIESDHLGQSIRVRIVRVFKAPAALRDGDVLTLLHHTCTSGPYDRDFVGSRFIGFFDVRGGRLRFDFCSTTASAWGPLPEVLRRGRARWLESRP